MQHYGTRKLVAKEINEKEDKKEKIEKRIRMGRMDKKLMDEWIDGRMDGEKDRWKKGNHQKGNTKRRIEGRDGGTDERISGRSDGGRDRAMEGARK